MYEIKYPDAKSDEPLLCGTSRPRPLAFGQQAPATGDVPAGPLPPQPQPDRQGGGCRPLISATNVTNAAIMGDGTIDGRGYAKLLGKDFSWWEMARRAEPKDDVYFSSRLIVANHADGLVLYRITLHNSPNFPRERGHDERLYGVGRAPADAGG